MTADFPAKSIPYHTYTWLMTFLQNRFPSTHIHDCGLSWKIDSLAHIYMTADFPEKSISSMHIHDCWPSWKTDSLTRIYTTADFHETSMPYHTYTWQLTFLKNPFPSTHIYDWWLSWIIWFHSTHIYDCWLSWNIYSLVPIYMNADFSKQKIDS
jgi:hypothetical protein